MNAYTWSDESFGRRLEDLWDSARAEVRHAVDYVDREIIPELRRDTADAARTVARHLDRLADKLDPQGSNGTRGL